MPGFAEMDRWPDDELLAAAAEGNEDAFGIFCTRSLPSIVRYVKYHCGLMGIPRHHAKDFTQEAFMKALLHIRKTLAAGREMSRVSPAWIKKIALNVAIDHRRATQDSVSLCDLVIPERTVDQETSERFDEIQKFFGWLGDTERELLEQVHVNGISVADAGALLNMNPEAARKALYRGLRRLQDLISEHGSAHAQHQRAAIG